MLLSISAEEENEIFITLKFTVGEKKNSKLLSRKWKIIYFQREML